MEGERYSIMNKENKRLLDKRYRESHKEEIAIKNKIYREKNKDTLANKHRKYVQNNKEHFKQYKHDYYMNNREELIERSKQYHKDNPHIQKKSLKNYYNKNKDRCKKMTMDWAKRNTDRVLQNHIKSLGNQALVLGMKTQSYRWALNSWSKAVKSRDNNFCQSCGGKDNLHAHHVVPKAVSPEFALLTMNGITECHGCHMNIHRGERN